MARKNVGRAIAALLAAVLTAGSLATGASAEIQVAPNDRMAAGSVLVAGSTLWSANNQVTLGMEADGNLVVRWQGGALWDSGTRGNPGARAVMNADGNLTVERDGTVLWQSNTGGWDRAQAIIQSDGHLVVVAPGGYPVWWKDKGRSPGVCNGVARDPRGTTITRWNPIVLCVLSALNQSPSHAPDILTMIRYESSGRPDAINLWDSNAQKGTPSKGLMQVIQPTFDRWRSPDLPNDLYNPAANIYAGINYAINRYGSITNIPGLVSLRNGGPYKGY